MKKGLIGFFVLLPLAACTPKAPDAARYTVEDYRANNSLRKATVRECANDPGTLAKTPDCVNAMRAEKLEGRGSLRNAPAIGLDPKKNPFGTHANPPDRKD